MKKNTVTSRRAVPGQYFLARGSAASWTGQWNSSYSPEVTFLRVSRSSFFVPTEKNGTMHFYPSSVCLLESFCTFVSVFVYFPFFLLSILYHLCCAFSYCAMLCAVLSWSSFLLFQKFHSSKERIRSHTSLTFWYI